MTKLHTFLVFFAIKKRKICSISIKVFIRLKRSETAETTETDKTPETVETEEAEETKKDKENEV